MQTAAVAVQPALTQMLLHPHRLCGLRMSKMAALHALCGGRQAVRGCQRRPGKPFIKQRKRYQHRCAATGKYAQPRVKQRDHQQIKREPGQIEKGKDTVTGYKPAQDHQVALCLLRQMTRSTVQFCLKCRIIDARIQCQVKLVAHADHQHITQIIQTAGQCQQSGHHQCQHQQCHFIARGQNTVVHLQHIHRRYQHQQINQRTE
ncbi:Uncharacterised protein [Morganella morganii]|nr:Uncharacterised protein [Morganella morganii]